MPRCDTCGTETEEAYLTKDPECYGNLCPICLRAALSQAEFDFHSAMKIYFDFLQAVRKLNEMGNER